MNSDRTRLVPVIVSCAALLIFASPGLGQYMYLDVDGNGINTSADVLTGSSPIQVHVYLQTNANRAGTPTSCITADGPLDLRSSYEFILRVSGGTVTWGNYKDDLNGLGGTGSTPEAQDAQDVFVWSNIGSVYSPGLYDLGYLEVTPTGGSPILSVASSTSLAGAYTTAFGASCYGLAYDNTMKLGREWTDADGTYGPAGGTISGLVWDDANGTSIGGCGPDPGELNLKGYLVSLAPTGQTAVTDALGNYSFTNLAPGIYTVSISPVASWNQTCPPGGAAQIVVLPPAGTIGSINFGVKKWPQATVDLVAKLTASCKNAPGSNSSLWVDCTNLGSDSPSATLTVTLPTEMVYSSSTPTGTFDSSLNTVTFSLGIVHSHEMFHFEIDFSIPSSAEANKSVVEAATLEPTATDYLPDDNYSSALVQLTDAWDPNEIIVSPEGRILRPQKLTYRVGFQNTGTAAATTVVVKLDLDPNLNLPSVGIGAASHPFSLALSGRQLIWTFDDINLPQSSADEPGSHGALTFTAQPLSSTPDGAVIQELANIYFDFNAPVATNTATSIIDSPPLLDPVPDRSVVEGGTVDQSLHGSDPEADPLTFTLTSGPAWASVATTGLQSGNLHLAPQAGDAGPATTLSIQASDGLLSATRNTHVHVFTVTGVAETEVFAPQDVQLNSGRPTTCIRLVRTVGQGGVASMGLTSFDLHSASTGSSVTVSAIEGQSGPVSADGSVCFKTSDIRDLFGSARGTMTVTISCEGRLVDGGVLMASIPITVHAAAGPLAASVSPNPSNPSATLTFRTTRPGLASASLFDLAGRKVRTLLKRGSVAAGYHQVPIDGRDDLARPLRSGVYFYRVETAEGSQVGRVTVVR